MKRTPERHSIRAQDFCSPQADLLRRGFTLVELLVVISIIGVILGMTIPRFGIFREQAKISALKSNMHQVQVVIETFHLEKGEYADDFYEDGYGSLFPGGEFETKLGRLPTNPWTGKEMDPDDFNPDDYDNLSDIADKSEFGPNDEGGYDPGEMRYSVWTPVGRDTPTNWGLIGFDKSGWSIRSRDAEDNIVIFVLHN